MNVAMSATLGRQESDHDRRQQYDGKVAVIDPSAVVLNWARRADWESDLLYVDKT